MGYSRQALSGFSWQTVLKFITMGITFFKIFVLARLLSPEDFGIFSIVAIALGLAEAITQTGVNITLLQLKDDLEKYISSAWVIAIIRGGIIAGLMLGLAVLLSLYYDQGQLLPLIACAALIPIIKGFINPYIISMQRSFAFSRETLYHSSLQLVEGLSAILLALIFQNAWIFIIAMIIAALIEVVISFVFFPFRPSLRYEAEKGRIILKNTRQFSLNALCSYLVENIDNLIIGKLLGTRNLGLYQNGYAISHKVNSDFAKSLHHGALPALNMISDDAHRLRKGFFKLLGSTATLSILLSIPFLLFPELTVRLTLGEQWLSVVPSLQWLVAAGILQSLFIIHYTLLFTREKVTVINMHLLLLLIFLVPGVILGSQYAGLEGAAMGIFFSRLITLPLLIHLTLKQLS